MRVARPAAVIRKVITVAFVVHSEKARRRAVIVVTAVFATRAIPLGRDTTAVRASLELARSHFDHALLGVLSARHKVASAVLTRTSKIRHRLVLHFVQLLAFGIRLVSQINNRLNALSFDAHLQKQ
jgi:hypothetical protein